MSMNLPRNRNRGVAIIISPVLVFNLDRVWFLTKGPHYFLYFSLPQHSLTTVFRDGTSLLTISFSEPHIGQNTTEVVTVVEAS